MDERLLQSARNGKKRAGQKDLINHLLGKRLTQRQAIKAHCYDCQGMGENPICDNEDCSLSPYSPYFGATRPRASGMGKSRQIRTVKGSFLLQTPVLRASTENKGIPEGSGSVK